MNPWLHSVILISKGARITRPKTKIDGLDCIVKSDQLRTLIERSIDSESAASALMTMGKLLSSEALEILHDEWPGCTAPCAAIGTRFWSV
ncbi:MAG: hypothetical protein ABI277_17365 [Burkholderiaceae bacterium]